LPRVFYGGPNCKNHQGVSHFVTQTWQADVAKCDWVTHVAPWASLPSAAAKRTRKGSLTSLLSSRRREASSTNAIQNTKTQRMRKFQFELPFLVALSIFCFFISFTPSVALYGPSSPVVQLNPSNFKSKVNEIENFPICFLPKVFIALRRF